ncbi:hypothetical protein L207DRAFT_583993 [Hyaloscypha variabilis F]|uniref:Uncharacterized protein n=1 Tax=Hyaloscypha variabilis (strain UAMH 11265 / GT02V1 / F) TaxID=1149755 RepID=A0A2J6RJ92_HYAVF|nr:hypothetical protein L207DRAFT_583993 [Hyaloscypha variabilis F]
MSANLYSAPYPVVQQQEREDIGYEQNRYSRMTPPRYSPITQPLPRKPVPVETVVPTGEPLTSSWGVGWKTPVEITTYYCLALVIAAAHLGFFLYLNHKPANGHGAFPQTYVAAISHLFASAVGASATALISIAFTQYTWRVFRRQHISVSVIEYFYTLRYKPLSFFSRNAFKTSPILFLLAITAWTIPVALIYPPGALIVVPFPVTADHSGIVPTYDAYYTGNDSALGWLSSIAAALSLAICLDLRRLATSTLLSGAIPATVSLCGTDCAFSQKIIAPYFDCTESIFNETLEWTGRVDAFSAQWNDSSVYSELFLLNFTRPIGMLDDYFAIEVHQFECATRRASYKLDTKYVDGERSLNYQVLNVSDIFTAWGDSETDGEVHGDDNWTMYCSINLFAIFDSIVTILSGNQQAVISPISAAYPDEGVPGSTYYAIPNKTMIDMTEFNTNLNYGVGDLEGGGAGPSYNITQDRLNQALFNLTLAIGYQIGYWNISTIISTTQMVNKYTFAAPLNFYIPYGVLLILSMPILVLAMTSLYQNGIPAKYGGFLQVLMTTRGNKDLDRPAAAGCLGGSHNVPKALEDMELRFGALVSGESESAGEVDGIVRAGFGGRGEVQPLQPNIRYGIASI